MSARPDSLVGHAGDAIARWDDGAGRSIVFIGGVHRSGTSLVARVVAQHPLASGLSGTTVPEDEGEHLQSVFPDSWDYGGVGRFGFAPEMHLTENSSLVDDRSRTTLWHEWSCWWDLDRPLLVEKSPPNMLKMRFLQALFPEARFVLIVRNPVVVTMATLKWRPRLIREVAPYCLADHWIRCHRIALADALHLKRFHLLKYEELVSDPGREMSRLAAFLGLDPPLTAPEIDPHSNERYLEAWAALKRHPLRRMYLGRVERRLARGVATLPAEFDLGRAYHDAASARP